MLKNILNLKGAQELSKNELKSINGGRVALQDGGSCKFCYLPGVDVCGPLQQGTTSCPGGWELRDC